MSSDEKHSEWVADIYHKGKRLRLRGCGLGEEALSFSVAPRHRAAPELEVDTMVTSHLHGRLVDYVDAPPPIFTEGAEKHG